MIETLHIITGLTVGGAEKALVRLLGDSGSRQNVAVVLSLTGTGPIANELALNGIQTYCVNFKSNPVLAAFRTFKIIRKLKPLRIQTWLYHADLIGGVFGRCAGVPSIFWNVRTTQIFTNQSNLKILRKILAALSYFIPNKIIYVSESAKKVHEDMGYSKNKSVVVPNGYILPDTFLISNERSALRKKIGIRNEDVVIGCVGRYALEKGYDIFLQSIEILYKRRPSLRLTVVLAGNNIDKENEELFGLISDLNENINIILLGEQKNMDEIYQTFDVFCLPSRTEAFPNVLCEAMSFKLPCVATNCGDVEKILQFPEFVAQAGDSRDLADKIERMLKLRDCERIEIGNKNRLFVANNFSIEKMRSSYDDLYKRTKRIL